MSTDLTPFNNDSPLVPAFENPYEALANEISEYVSFLPRIQLFISSSDAVKAEKIPMNHYGFVSGKDQIESLGKEVDVLVICWRPRALDTSDKARPIATSDTSSPLWADIKSRADDKDLTNSGCQYGYEFLLWIPKKKEFATYLMGTKSARMEATRTMLKLVRKPATLKSATVKNDKFTWQAPKCFPCSTPMDLPTTEELEIVAKDFLHPVEQKQPEKVEQNEQRDR